MSRGRGQSTELLYGRNAVIEALRGRRRHRKLYVASGAEKQERIRDLLKSAHERNLPVTQLQANELSRIVGPVNHQGVVLETAPYPYVALASILDDPQQRPIVILDHVQDPQNLGTLLRTADAAGAAGFIIPDRRAARVTPAVVNASAGAVEHLNVAQVTNVSRAVEDCKAAGYWIVALEHQADARSIFRESIPNPTALLIGSEGRGIGTALLSHSDLIVRIPMVGDVASLNASVAGSIALYELLRRRLEQDR